MLLELSTFPNYIIYKFFNKCYVLVKCHILFYTTKINLEFSENGIF